jgi:hypothetical protein
MDIQCARLQRGVTPATVSREERGGDCREEDSDEWDQDVSG